MKKLALVLFLLFLFINATHATAKLSSVDKCIFEALEIEDAADCEAVFLAGCDVAPRPCAELVAGCCLLNPKDPQCEDVLAD